MQERDEFSGLTIATLVLPVWTYKKTVIAMAALGLALSLVFVAKREKEFTATVTILPESSAGKSLNLPFLAGMGGFPGLGMNENSELRILPEIVKSNVLLEDLYRMKFASGKFPEPASLHEIWGMKDTITSRRQIIKELKTEAIEFTENRTSGLMSLSVKSKDSVFSAAFANTLVEKLNVYMISQKKSKASEQRIWIESRIKEVEAQLARKEGEMQTFRERNISISESPSLTIQNQRILRDLEMIKEVFIELKKQLEAFKIQEIKESPSIQVLDSALVPEKKSNAPAAKIMAASTVAAGMAGVLLAYLLFFLGRSAEIGELKGMLVGNGRSKEVV